MPTQELHQEREQRSFNEVQQYFMKNLSGFNMTGGYGQPGGMQDRNVMNGQQRPGGFQGGRGYQGGGQGGRHQGGKNFNNRGRTSGGNNMRSAGGNRDYNNMQALGQPVVNPAGMQMSPEQMAQMQAAQQ